MTRHVFLATRLAALLGTSYFLLATSQIPDPVPSQVCIHAGESVTFRVAGTCGATGTIVVGSPLNECAITVQGASEVGLPAAGRFTHWDSESVGLADAVWALSGYLPEGALSGAMAVKADAGGFSIERDAQANSDLGTKSDASGITVSPALPMSHGSPVVRTCTTTMTSASVTELRCTDGSVQSCQATLTRVK